MIIDLIVTTAAKLATDTNKKQIGFLVGLAICVLVFVGIYEHYTSSFRFSRLEKGTALLKELDTLKKSTGSDDHLSAVYDRILLELDEVLGVEFPKLRSHSKLLRFGVGMIPWVALSLLFVPRIRKGAKDELNIIYVICAFGAFCSLVAMFLPESAWPWMHALVYPVVFVLALVGVIVVASPKNEGKEPKKTKKNPKEKPRKKAPTTGENPHKTVESDAD